MQEMSDDTPQSPRTFRLFSNGKCKVTIEVLHWGSKRHFALIDDKFYVLNGMRTRFKKCGEIILGQIRVVQDSRVEYMARCPRVKKSSGWQINGTKAMKMLFDKFEPLKKRDTGMNGALLFGVTYSELQQGIREYLEVKQTKSPKIQSRSRAASTESTAEHHERKSRNCAVEAKTTNGSRKRLKFIGEQSSVVEKRRRKLPPSLSLSKISKSEPESFQNVVQGNSSLRVENDKSSEDDELSLDEDAMANVFMAEFSNFGAVVDPEL